MSQLPVNQAVPRFQANEERMDKFVNDPTSYTTSGGTVVPSLPFLSTGLQAEFNALYSGFQTYVTNQEAVVSTDVSNAYSQINSQVQTALSGLNTTWSNGTATINNAVSSATTAINSQNSAFTAVINAKIATLTTAIATALAAGAGSSGWTDTLVSVIASVTGGVNRTQHDKNSDLFTVKDVGAKGDGSTDDTAAFNAACAASRHVHIPAGTYIISSWTIPANTTITTAGFATIIQQKSGVADGTSIIKIGGSNINLGDIQISGNIADSAQQSTSNEQNHAILCQANATTGSISRITIGNVLATNIRGDGVLLMQNGNGSSGNYLHAVTVNSVFCNNVYRNGVSIVSGTNLLIRSVFGYQCGMDAIDIESDAGTGLSKQIVVDFVYGGRIGITGATASDAPGWCKFGSVILDPNLVLQSVPNYGAALWGQNCVAMQYIDHLHFDMLSCANSTDYGIAQFNAISGQTAFLTIGHLKMRNCSNAQSSLFHGYINIGNTILNIGTLDLVLEANKAFLTNTSPAGTIQAATITMKQGSYVLLGQSSSPNTAGFKVNNCVVTTPSGTQYAVFCQGYNNLLLDNFQCSGIDYVLVNCNTALIRGSSITTNQAAFTSAGQNDQYLIATTVNGTFYRFGPYTQSYALPYKFGSMYVWQSVAGDLRCKLGVPTADTDGAIMFADDYNPTVNFTNFYETYNSSGSKIALLGMTSGGTIQVGGVGGNGTVNLTAQTTINFVANSTVPGYLDGYGFAIAYNASYRLKDSGGTLRNAITTASGGYLNVGDSAMLTRLNGSKIVYAISGTDGTYMDNTGIGMPMSLGYHITDTNGTVQTVVSLSSTTNAFGNTAWNTNVVGNNQVGIVSSGALQYTLTSSAILPQSDNARNLGSASFRFSVIYAGTGSINTSDERHKQQFRSLEDAEKAAALAIKSAIGMFKFNDSVAIKGADGARWHCGVKAQQIVQIMTDHNLKPLEYAFICYDKWDAEDELVDITPEQPAIEAVAGQPGLPYRPAQDAIPAVIDNDGKLISSAIPAVEERLEVMPIMAVEAREAIPEKKVVLRPAIEAGDRWGIRYDELIMFIIAAM